MDLSIPSDSDAMEKYNEDLENYKGIFYNNYDQEDVFYEFGAHFSYFQMYKRLEEIVKQIEKDSNREESEIRSQSSIVKEESKLVFK